MSKIKPLLGGLFTIALVAVYATPALAEWQSLPSTGSVTTGKIHPINGGAFNATFVGVSATFKCPASGIEAEWQIRSTGKILEEFKGPGQQLTKRGPHDQIVIKKWGTGKNGSESCLAEALGLKAGVEIAPCTLQIHQNVGATKEIAGDQITECLMKGLGCEIKIPPVTVETKGENFQLTGVTLENKGENQFALAGITGVKATASGGACLVSGTTNTARLESFEWEQLRMNAV
jgi:hypothetical protein